MTDPTELTPPTPDPSGPITFTGGPVASSPSWWSRWHRFVIGGAGVAVVAAAAAGALILVLNPTATVEKIVPASVDVYGLVSLDPSAGQKLNLLQAVHRFPDTSTDKKISEQLDKAFKDSGLTFSGDVQPWLGPQLGFALQLPKDSGDPPTALLISSRDDAKAKVALTKLQTGKYGKDYKWSTKTYDGVTITVGSPTSASGKPGAYALVDHVVIIASSEDLIHQIIDTDRGRSARLVDSSDYKATFAKLPSDRLALVYVNGKSLVAKLKSQMSDLASPSMRSLLPQGVNNQGIADANALQGIGLVLSARSDGIALDVAAKLDPSKLSASTKAALLQSGDAGNVVAWVPTTADGFWSVTGLKQSIQAALDQVGNSDPSVKAGTDEIGLTGPDGVLPHLTGDAGLEATVDASITPAGAIVLGTDNAASMQKFLGGILSLAAENQTSATTHTSIYRGVKITTLDYHQPFLAGRLSPSYAVLDGMGILASRQAEVVAVINAHKDHHSIASDPTYVQASQASLAHPAGIFYLDLARLVAVIEQSPALGSGAIDSKAKADLAPLKAFIVTGTSSQDGMLERLVVIIR
jgi:hypothetical protein